MTCRLSRRGVAAAFLTLPLLSFTAAAELALSANDGKAVLIDGVNAVPANPPADSVTIIDLGASPPRAIHEIKAPASVVGPPLSVAVAPDESIALVTAATKLDPADPKKTTPDNKLSVIDLKASPPAVIATLEAGAGAAGVSINKAGTLALVANRSDGTVSVFSISGKTVTPAGVVDFGNKASGPSHAVFTSDGKTALVTRDGDNKISVLSIDGGKVEYTKRDVSAGLRPYGIDVTPDGKVAVVANIGTGSGDADTISVIDVAAKPPRVVDTVTVGQTPEGIKLSPDGRHVAVTVMNGSNKPKNSPFFNDHGLVRVYRLDGTKLTHEADARVGHWCQGALFSRDGRTLLVQCMVEKEIQVFGFDGKELKAAGTIKTEAGPAGIRSAER
ncbi:MAG TPA: YncE family protein [Xanthobacteraceae bacterium]|nr:YncE family protein [Xanthobacteraceae bacterium]